MPRACWGSQSWSGRSQRRLFRFTLQFRRRQPGRVERLQRAEPGPSSRGGPAAPFVGPGRSTRRPQSPRYGQRLQTRAVKSHFEIYHKPRAKADRLPSFSASFWESPHPKLETPCDERAAVAARSPPRATQSARACHSARRTVRPVHPRLRDPALRVAAARRDPAADAEIAMSI